ncbi:hypothetical protein RD1_3752 [Roseobacter denitrificans OCh 114]|uniref:Uncharacterized protein n=1 Tax=Roseobacter denitrificans (strain ATCC 33942 / OCh 114) TaxID=375451 RepID=Q161X2_ROSDO|nr:hypothetical protein RD1_3752 [Roseobacter denitrificans OCh 114]
MAARLVPDRSERQFRKASNAHVVRLSALRMAH